MKVYTFIQNIADTDLSQIALSDVGSVISDLTIEQAKNVRILLSFLQSGLIELYRIFPIKISIYDDTFTSPSEPDDLVVLPDTALALQKVLDKNQKEVPVDDPSVERAFERGFYKKVFVKTISINKYSVGGNVSAKNPAELYFYYHDAPEPLTLKSEIGLPTYMLDALSAYVSYKAYSTNRYITNAGDTAIQYKKLYDSLLKDIKDSTDVYVYDFDVERLYLKGFV